MSEPYQITEHAIVQFRRRWRPDKSDPELHDELMALLRTSKPFDKTILGDQIHISGHFPEIRMVVKDRVVCVTVLPRRDNRTNANDVAIQEEMERLAEEQSEREEILKGQMEEIKKQITVIDHQRKELGIKKVELNNQLQALHNQVKYGMKV